CAATSVRDQPLFVYPNHPGAAKTRSLILTPINCEPAFRFYRSLCPVKVLLASLRSTLTVLAPAGRRWLSVHVEDSCSLILNGRLELVIDISRSAFASRAFTRSNSSFGTCRPSVRSIK